MTDRPKRKSIPRWLKRQVEARQCGKCFCGCNASILPGSAVEWDHSPALQLRPLNAGGTDYVPAQLDPDHIVARCPESHKRKTLGHSKATTLGSDIANIAKIKRIIAKASGKTKPKRKIQSRKMQSGNSWPKGRKIQSRGFEKRKET